MSVKTTSLTPAYLQHRIIGGARKVGQGSWVSKWGKETAAYGLNFSKNNSNKRAQAHTICLQTRHHFF